MSDADMLELTTTPAKDVSPDMILVYIYEYANILFI